MSDTFKASNGMNVFRVEENLYPDNGVHRVVDVANRP